MTPCMATYLQAWNPYPQLYSKLLGGRTGTGFGDRGDGGGDFLHRCFITLHWLVPYLPPAPALLLPVHLPYHSPYTCTCLLQLPPCPCTALFFPATMLPCLFPVLACLLAFLFPLPHPAAPDISSTLYVPPPATCILFPTYSYSLLSLSATFSCCHHPIYATTYLLLYFFPPFSPCSFCLALFSLISL